MLFNNKFIWQANIMGLSDMRLLENGAHKLMVGDSID